jgi:hypothetical protein
MTNRDLLHKPIPVIAPDDQAGGKKLPGTPALNKLGVQNRAREIGGELDPALPATQEPAAPAATPRARETAKARGPAAFRAAYFNKDVESTGAVNQRTSSMKALRGDEGASDLKRIVIPQAMGIDTPDPQVLGQAFELMAPHTLEQLDLSSLLARQGAWSKQKGVTAEMIAQRLAQLKQMVQDRLIALQRLAKLSPQRLMRSATLAQAATSEGRAHEDAPNLAEAGRDLVQSTAAQAEGMHTRLAKALGVKPKG